MFWSSLPETVSVVSVSVVGEESGGLWQRPVGGVAVFVVRSAERPVLELTAYGTDGTVIARRSAALDPGGGG